MAEKIFNTRIALKVDTLENWNKSTLALKKGEIAIATVAASEGLGLAEPVVMIKVGEDGGKTFKELGWNLHAKASDVLAACKSEASLKTFVNSVIADAGIASSDAMEALAGRVTAAEGEIDALQAALDTADTGLKARMTDAEGKITALQGLVGDKVVATQISEAIAALKLAETYDAKGAAAQALVDAKAYTDEKDSAMDIRVASLEGKFGEGEGSVSEQINSAIASEKTDRENAIAGVNQSIDTLRDTHNSDKETLEASIKSADDKAVAAQADIDALEVKVGEVTEGKTVVGMIAEAQAAATYDDTKVKADITALQGLVGDKVVATQISTAVKEETDRAKGVEGVLETRLAAVEGDYLKAVDKKALQDQIDANESAIELLTNGVSADEVDGVNDLIQYVKDHGTEVTGMKADIKANTDAIDAIEADYLKSADKTELVGGISALEARMDSAEDNIATKAAASDVTDLAGRVTTAEGKVSTLQTEMDAVEGRASALEAKVGDDAVSVQISEAIAALKIGDYAKAADLTAAIARIAQNEQDIDALEGRASALETSVGALHAIAKSGNVNDLVQSEGDVLVFDCGTSV